MSVGFAVAISAMPFFNQLDSEEEALAAQVVEADDDRKVAAAMDASRRRLAQGVETFVRGLPAAIRHDANTSRAAAYAVVGLADERMLHHAAGGLERWRNRLLEFELYGSALAGQEVIRSARLAAQGGGDSGQDWLAPLYLALFREGFEGSLRGDLLSLTTVIATLEDALGVVHDREIALASGPGPKRAGVSPMPLAVAGVTAWLVTGLTAWFAVSEKHLALADRMATRIEAQAPFMLHDPLDRSVGPSRLPELREQGPPRPGDKDAPGERGAEVMIEGGAAPGVARKADEAPGGRDAAVYGNDDAPREPSTGGVAPRVLPVRKSVPAVAAAGDVVRQRDAAPGGRDAVVHGTGVTPYEPSMPAPRHPRAEGLAALPDGARTGAEIHGAGADPWIWVVSADGARFLQFGAYANRSNAERAASHVRGLTPRPVEITTPGDAPGAALHRVRMGPFPSLGPLREAIDDLRAHGYRIANPPQASYEVAPAPAASYGVLVYRGE